MQKTTWDCVEGMCNRTMPSVSPAIGRKGGQQWSRAIQEQGLVLPFGVQGLLLRGGSGCKQTAKEMRCWGGGVTENTIVHRNKQPLRWTQGSSRHPKPRLPPGGQCNLRTERGWCFVPYVLLCIKRGRAWVRQHQHSALALDKRRCQCAVRSVCAADLVAGPAQAAVPAHRHRHPHQLCWPSAGLALPVQGCTEGMPGAGGRMWGQR